MLQAVIDGAAALPVRLLVTLGDTIAPEELAPAANTALVHSAPHNAVMPEADSGDHSWRPWHGHTRPHAQEADDRRPARPRPERQCGPGHRARRRNHAPGGGRRPMNSATAIEYMLANSRFMPKRRGRSARRSRGEVQDSPVAAELERLAALGSQRPQGPPEGGKDDRYAPTGTGLLLRRRRVRGTGRAAGYGLLPLRRLPRWSGGAAGRLHALAGGRGQRHAGRGPAWRVSTRPGSATGVPARIAAAPCSSSIRRSALVDIPAGKLPTLTFAPAVHLNYAATRHPMQDGLPKFRDFPTEIGGSGETMAE